MKHIALLAPLALSACATPFAAGSPYAFDNKGDLVEFNYAWSAEATATPALARHLRGDLESSWRAAATTAHADRVLAQANKRKFVGHQYSRRWTTAGQSTRLISLSSNVLVFTGGAQPSRGADGLVWDRRQNKEVKATALFTSGDDLSRLVRAPFCDRLAAERQRRLGVANGNGGNMPCPGLDALAFVPSDRNGNRRFDEFRVIAPHGAAGAYAEGSYDLGIPVTAAMRAALKPLYRSSFEAL